MKLSRPILLPLLMVLLGGWMPHGKVPSYANVFYVCPTGSDSNNGTSPDTPWQTLGKVAATTFSPNTGIFLCGTTPFSVTSPSPSNTNAAVIITSARASGTAGNPIVLDSYAGSATINDSGTGYTLLVGAAYFQVKNITFNSTTAARGIFYFINTASTIKDGAVISGNIVQGYGYNGNGSTQNGIQLAGSNSNTSGWSNYQILNNLVDGTGTNALDQGIFVNASTANTNGLIQGNIVRNVAGRSSANGGTGGASGNGILVSQVNGATVQYNLTYNLGANTTTCGGPAGQWAYQSTNVTIQFGESYNAAPTTYQITSASYDSGAGQVTFGFASPVTYAVGDSFIVWGMTGTLWNRQYTVLAGSTSTSLIATIQSNPGAATVLGKTVTTGCDWTGFNLDDATSSSIVQYNYAHDNFGSAQTLFYKASTQASYHDNHFRFNIYETVDNTASNQSVCFYLGTSGSATLSNVFIYNNTCWIKSGGKGFNFLTNTTGIVVANNILALDGGGGYFVYAPFQSSATNSLFIGNDYFNVSGTFNIIWQPSTFITTFANWRASGQETLSGSPVGTTADPKFVSGGSGGTCSWVPSSAVSWPPAQCPSGYKLQNTSTMIGTGLTPAQVGVSDFGTRDYYGNTVPHGSGTGYNIGAYGGL